MRLFGIVDLPTRIRARLVLREALRRVPECVLDLGSGAGSYSFFFSRNSAVEVCGVEINGERADASNRIASELGRNNLRFCAANGLSHLRTVESSSVNLVLAVEVLQYLPDLSAVLRELNRILKPGGRFIGHVPYRGLPRPYEVFQFDDSNLKGMLMDAGFNEVRICRTFGGVVLRLCEMWDIIRPNALKAVIFPVFLVISLFFPVESSDGRYMCFGAVKGK